MEKIKSKLEEIKFLLMDYKKELFIGTALFIILIISIILYISLNSPSKKEQINSDIFKDATIVDIEDKKEDTIDEIKEEIIEEKPINKIKVDIKGEVNKPGVYELNSNSRVTDVINLANGLTKSADTSVINLSKTVFDEMVIIIYSKEQVKDFKITKEEQNTILEEIKKPTNNIINNAVIDNDKLLDNIQDIPSDNPSIEENTTNKTEEQPEKININTADISLLTTLSGIGESKANSIIKYREENNGFKNIEEVKNVSGIGESVYEKIKDNITI